MIGGLCKFTLKAYEDFLARLLSKYTIIPFNKIANTNSPYLILRHDVDASLDSALIMAQLENRLKIKSTYFVLFSYKLYNLLEKDSMITLRKISELGHEIGLHYDLEVYETHNRKITDVLVQEINLLESIVSQPVVSIARHNSSMQYQGDPLMATSYINAYDDSLYDVYVSDSCRAWDIGSLSRLLSFKDEKAQLLVHPFMWKKYPVERDELLEDFFKSMRDENYSYKKRWKTIWDENPKVKKYDKETLNINR